ncbi:MAG: tetratricopeptide repeat protein [Luteolibacter sp.]|jgi:tetratricopeptide (TPR) repeat protein|nr:tetratricopeptide repeat protein [Luteolibacter sp.]
MNSPTATLIGILQDRVETLRAAGNLDEALHAATAAVEKAQQSLGPDLDSIDAFASTLELRGDIHRQLGNYELSREDYRQAIDQLDNRPDRLAQIGRLHAGLGAAYDGMGREDKAGEQWHQAIEFFERHEPPLMLDVAAMTNNLGFLYKAAGNLDMAETQFLRALEILHSQLGQDHEQTATVSSNLGALYQAAGFHEQSRQMHEIALETRRKLLGEEHPDTAQSHNNLALALLNTGDRAWARRHFERALADFEALGPEYLEDLEAVASNYCDFLREEGESQLAEVIAGRLREVTEAAAC